MEQHTTETLLGELAVVTAERNQADRRVDELEGEVSAQQEWIEELRAKVREWEELERWRQAQWNELKKELHSLREENAELRSQLASTPQ